MKITLSSMVACDKMISEVRPLTVSSSDDANKDYDEGRLLLRVLECLKKDMTS